MRLVFPFLLAVAAVATPNRPTAAQSVAQSSPDTTQARNLEVVRVTATRASSIYGVESSSATRLDGPLRDIPKSVSIVTHQLIADQSMQSMSDVVRYTPGVSMASGEGHRDAPSIRGNSTTADFFVDGLRDDGQYLRDLYNVDRVEVLKGSDAMLFGRGGGGGVINRVSRQAQFTPVLSFGTEGGSFDHKRATLDAGEAIGSRIATRLDAMYERSGGFRHAAELRRYGINPTAALMLDDRTLVRAGYERFDDNRRVDRGIPSFRGGPAPANITTFFGNPSVNRATSTVNLATASITRQVSDRLVLRERFTFGDYDLFYQNTYPGAVNGAGDRVTLSGYNHAVPRRNVLSSTDATYTFDGAIKHTFLAGADLSRQRSSQVRRTGYFGDSVSSYLAPISAPTIDIPVTFRASATDANNNAVVNDAAAYLQDRIELGSAAQVIGGVRYERFDVRFHDNRANTSLRRTDALISPKVGVVLKPVEAFSAYASYGVSFLPSSGDQFSSLTVTTATLEPEQFTNREIGIKWDAASRLALTGALYRLDRTNTSSPDPVNAGLVVQTGAQRTNGWEVGATGAPLSRWQIAAGFASQRATIVSTTSAARAGASIPLVPHTSLSMWNRVQLTPRVGVGAGLIHQTRVYAAIDNSVTLPGFTRVDGALYANLRPGLRAQMNVENVFDVRYYPTTQGNNNIMPGAPRTLRLSLTVSRD
jgi:catecholate siderophore receptor